MSLVNEPDTAFYIVEHQCEGVTFRVFNYRLASYTDFIKPSALESRGTMFEMKHGQPVRLASLAPAKFFNYKENPLVMDIDFSEADVVMDKMDGSIMTTYMIHGNTYLKSKTSLSSEQANAAMEFLFSGKNEKLIKYLEHMENEGYSVSLEWTSPVHRIVLPYQEDKLTVLHVRNRNTGKVLSYSQVIKTMLSFDPLVIGYMVPCYAIDDVSAFVDSIPAKTGVEGYIIVVDGVLTKHKTDWYCSLHNLKDDINSPKKRFIVVVNEGHDDARANFSYDAYMIKLIDEMELKVKAIYRDIDKYVTGFYNANRHLERKDYAIKGTAELERLYFSLAMNLYLGKENDYKAWMIKHYKEFGIGDDPELTETE
jgi:RNA ligase